MMLNTKLVFFTVLKESEGSVKYKNEQEIL